MGMINRAVPAGQLESAVFELASEIAKTPAEMLTIQKAAANAAAEAMGMSGILESAVIYDVMAQASRTARGFRKVVREQGIMAGLELLKSGNFDPNEGQGSGGATQ